jgi:transcription elongation factor/antiterminator RfaH
MTDMARIITTVGRDIDLTMVPIARGLLKAVENQRWFLVHSLPRSERRAEWHLRAQGFRTFLPQFERTVRHARKLRSVKAPLFPNYLFVEFDLGWHRWTSIRSTVGVSRLHAQRDGTPIAVPHGIIETLIGQCDGDLMRLDDGLFEGQQVRILSGPFADLVGNLKKLKEAGRVQVLLQMMGSAVPVILHRSALAPAA